MDQSVLDNEILLAYTLGRTVPQPNQSQIAEHLFKHQYEELIALLMAELQLDPQLDLFPAPTASAAAAAVDPARLQLLGVALLQLFVRTNWTDHSAASTTSHNAGKSSSPQLTEAVVESVLVADSGGESLVAAAADIGLLAAAKVILVDRRPAAATSNALVSALWALRCCLTLQEVLEEKAERLHTVMAALIAEGRTALPDDPKSSSRLLAVLFHLEVARYHSVYHEVREMQAAIGESSRCAGLRVWDTGALGRRTKYQAKDIAQFTLGIEFDDTTVSEKEEEEEEDTINPELLPTDLKLNDDVRLDKVQFVDARHDNLLHLSAVQQCVLMARFCAKRRAIPAADELTIEELEPHLTPILSRPVCWSAYVAALLYRSQLECQHSRSVERARAQLETIIERLHTEPASADEADLRLRHIHSSRLPPRWEVERSLASILVSLGATKAALEHYLRIQYWDEVIACYNLIQMRHKAAEVIKERMASKGETARLWCQLGDATDDLNCYHKALAMSRNNRNARAFRSLGLHYYYAKNYARAIEYFDESLAVSRFQLDVWLRLGFAALELEDWAAGARAYRAYTSLESDNFEAWNNLAKCYIRLGQKERAWRVLHEALRCDYDNWKVWDNLLAIATDLAVFEDTLRAYNRILDLKQQQGGHVDSEVLGILVRAVTEKLADSAGVSSEKYREPVAKLLARLTVSQPREPDPWRHYARLLLAGEPSPEDQVKGCTFLQKSLAAHTAQRGWEKDLSVCRTVLGLVSELAAAILSVSTEAPRLQLSNSARFALTGALRLVQQGQTSISTGSLVPDLVADYENSQQLVDRVKEITAG